MSDILHRLHVTAVPARVWEAVATPAGLDAWWTKRSSGRAAEGEEWVLFFGDGWDWRGVVRVVEPGRRIEWEITLADADWTGTRVAVDLADADGGTRVEFSHSGWAGPGEHFRVSSYCWAAYLRLLKRWVERGENVPYEARYEA